jgi:type IV pilus assembly protein PilB
VGEQSNWIYSMSSPNDLSQSSLPPFAKQLIQSGYMTPAQLQQALIEKRKTDRPLIEILPMITGRPLPDNLLPRHRTEKLSQLQATYGVDCLDPETEAIDWKGIEHLFKTLLPFEICRRYQILPLHKQESSPIVLRIAMVDPANREILDDLRRILRDRELQFERRAIALADYQKLIETYRLHREETDSPERSVLEKARETLVDVTDVFEDERSDRLLHREESGEDLGLAYQANQNPIVTLVNNILVRAIESKASEIHLEPDERELMIQFRQDGQLRSGFEPISREVAPDLLSRVKTLANFDLAPGTQHRPGKITKTFSGRKIDFHVHTLPGPHGEKIVLRVFDSRSALWTLDELIILEATRSLVESLLDRPSGLILLTSPAGGGISTTFYSLLASRHQAGRNIATIEKPSERVLKGVLQIESDVLQGSDYPLTLQSFQERGVNLLGIDRLVDRASAAMAIEAARSGHLVIATLPSESATAAITRLRELTDPRSVCSAVIGVIHQRLARRVCPVCRLKQVPTTEELNRLGLSPRRTDSHFYKANALTDEEILRAGEKGRLCRHCNGIGYQGQIALFEVMNLSPRLQTAIADRADADTLVRVALADGFSPLPTYGLALVERGLTTLEEIERVLGDRLPLSPSSPSHPTSISPTIMKRIEELERLIGALGNELQALKQEIGTSSPDSIVHEDIPEPPPRKAPTRDREADQETIVSDPSVYEELTDPGDWERLKQELDPTKDTMVTVDPQGDDPSSWPINTSFRSVPDPWK